MRKELKFKIYNYECVDCGHKTWRDYKLENPICSECNSEKAPNITEDVLVKEMVINDTYTPEQYEECRRITQDLIDGKPLEEIEGIDLGESCMGEDGCLTKDCCASMIKFVSCSFGSILGTARIDIQKSIDGMTQLETERKALKLKYNFY